MSAAGPTGTEGGRRADRGGRGEQVGRAEAGSAGPRSAAGNRLGRRRTPRCRAPPRPRRPGPRRPGHRRPGHRRAGRRGRRARGRTSRSARRSARPAPSPGTAECGELASASTQFEARVEPLGHRPDRRLEHPRRRPVVGRDPANRPLDDVGRRRRARLFPLNDAAVHRAAAPSSTLVGDVDRHRDGQQGGRRTWATAAARGSGRTRRRPRDSSARSARCRPRRSGRRTRGTAARARCSRGPSRRRPRAVDLRRAAGGRRGRPAPAGCRPRSCYWSAGTAALDRSRRPAGGRRTCRRTASWRRRGAPRRRAAGSAACSSDPRDVEDHHVLHARYLRLRWPGRSARPSDQVRSGRRARSRNPSRWLRRRRSRPLLIPQLGGDRSSPAYSPTNGPRTPSLRGVTRVGALGYYGDGVVADEDLLDDEAGVCHGGLDLVGPVGLGSFHAAVGGFSRRSPPPRRRSSRLDLEPVGHSWAVLRGQFTPPASIFIPRKRTRTMERATIVCRRLSAEPPVEHGRRVGGRSAQPGCGL